MRKLIKKVTALLSVAAVIGTMAVMPAMAEETASVNLLSSAVLKKADYNNGTNVSDKFNLLTDGDYTNNQTIGRGSGTYTYYAVYEVDAVITNIASYYTNTTNGGKVIFYGSNDSDLALITTPPTEDLGWDGSGKTKSETDFMNTYKLTYLGNTGNGTQEDLSVGETTVYKKAVDISDTTGYKYIVLLLDGWDKTNVSEIEVTGTKKLDPLTTETVIWAQDIIDRGGNHQGSSGNVETNEFGNFQNVEDEIKIFFPDAANGDAIVELIRINGIDNASSAGWKGYISAEITAEIAGKYNVYVLGNTNPTDRAIEVTNNTTESSSRATTDVKQYSTKNYLKVMTVKDVEFVAGVNELKIQAPSGKSAPNFIAMYITKANEEPTETAMEQATFGGTFNGADVNGKEIVSGDETTTVWKGTIEGATSGKVVVTATSNGEERSVEGNIATITGAGVTEFFVIINKAADAISSVTYKIVD